jgi:hypothetical protein
MKRLTFAFLFIILLTTVGFSQSKPYVTSGLEMIFSLADIQDKGSSENAILRWAPILNIQAMLNKDISEKFGLFTGLAVRNVGYIYGGYTDPATDIVYKKKFRSYNLAVPFGIKLGNLEGMFIYGGYELELPVRYKEKTFDNGDKINTITGWFSNREEPFQHGFLVGVEFPYGLNVKFKYYLSEFHNQNYTDGSGTKPYEGLKSHIFYFSLSSYLFKNFDFYTTPAKKSNNL